MLDQDSLIDLVRSIKEGDYASLDEADAAVDRLVENVIDPFALDYIFQKEYDHLTPEEIVEKILAYKPILL
jgi:hypothetical protein